MPDETDAKRALELIERGDFKTGDNWTKAHEIAQGHEGVPIFDAIHALLHRIEGDTSNASYWDRRAGTDFGGNGHAAELAQLRDLTKSG